jgi:hypothetical protein
MAKIDFNADPNEPPLHPVWELLSTNEEDGSVHATCPVCQGRARQMGNESDLGGIYECDDCGSRSTADYLIWNAHRPQWKQ